jgi:hypothetical protein
MFNMFQDELLANERLACFIEKPSQNCTPEEFEFGVREVVSMLDKDPAVIVRIIDSHLYIPSTYLFYDLIKKMREQQCIDKLSLLLDACLDKLIDICIYNKFDLERFVKASPNHLEGILENVLSNKHRLKKIFNTEENREQALRAIIENAKSSSVSLR